MPALSTAIALLSLAFQVGPEGLTSLKAGDAELLADGKFQVQACYFARQDGSTYAADLAGGKSSFDQEAGRVTRTYAWGTVSAAYKQGEGRLAVAIDVTNLSPTDSIVSLQLVPLRLKFPKPTDPRNPAFRTPWMVLKGPSLSHGMGEPGLVVADYGAGVLAICNEQITQPLAMGLASADGNARLTYDLLVYTGRHKVLPNKFPFIDRPVAPLRSDKYELTLRFAKTGTSYLDLAGDLYERFAAAYPYKLKWTDRKPIGVIHLGRSEPGWPTNPRGYLNDAKIDVTSPEGRESFRTRLMAYADSCLKIMNDMDAQGVIVWDIEGQESKHPISYLGDPRSLPPEMEPIADEFMKKFTDLGFSVGITIRPQVPVRRPYSPAVMQIMPEDTVGNMNAKIAYAKKRWGCTIFYLDSNVKDKPDPVALDGNRGVSLLMMADELRQVNAAHPDVLVIPEIEDVQTYAYGAPYLQLNYDKLPGTPADVKRAYPQAFGINSVAEGDIDKRPDEIARYVKAGDVLFYRTWFGDTWNKHVKRVYDLAGSPLTPHTENDPPRTPKPTPTRPPSKESTGFPGS